MKLISDFDGVWTLPDDEASAQGAWMERTLAEWAAGAGLGRVPEWLAAARASVAAEPKRWGWVASGRLSAFADEDPFVAHAALLHWIGVQAADDAVGSALKRVIEEHGFTLDSFGSHAHAAAVGEVARRRGPGVLPDAARAGLRLLEAGVEIVVVSNSVTAKLSAWFDHAGVPWVVHPERRAGALCLRGAARKFELDPERRRPLLIGSVEVDTARPAYEAILRDERPDAVVGDAFSLDLALPLALRRAEPSFRAMRLLWLVRPYTPGWLRREVEAGGGGLVECVEGGFAGAAEALLGAQRPT